MELRRTVRQIRADPARFWLYLLLAFGMSLLSVVLALGAFVYLGTTPTLTARPRTLDSASRATIVGFWSFWLLVYVSRTLSSEPRIDAESVLLPAAGPRAVLTGLVIAEWLRLLAYLVGPVVVVGATAAYTLSAPLWLLAIVTTVCLATLTIALTAHAIALGGAVAVVRYPVLARYRIVIGGVGALLIAAPYVLVREARRGELGRLGAVPIGWFADLFVVGAPILQGSPLRAAGAIAVSVAMVGGVGLVAERWATTYWYGDGRISEIGRSAGRNATGSTPLGHVRGRASAVLDPIGQPTRVVTLKTILLTRRKPGRLAVFLVPLAILAGNLFVTEDGLTVPWVAPVVGALVCPWLAGVAFGLNPLGDEGGVLPATLTSSVSGAAFVRGLVLPGGLLGIATVFPAVVGTGLWLGYDPVALALLAVLALSLTCLSLSLAPAIGLRAPRFDAISARGNDEIVPPSLTAIVGHAVVLAVVFGLGVLCWAVPELLALDPATGRGSSSGSHLRTGGVSIVSILSVALGVYAYRSAVTAFDRATID
jgi:hypothetical protein